jgi:hypothetical protein
VSELPNVFDEDGIWLRCGLHAHTTNSDGELPPDKLARHYEWAGYDVLAITDHWIRTDEPSTEQLLVIPGAELNAQAGGASEDVHVLALGIEVDPVLPEGEFASLAETVEWISSSGGVPFIAHTYWSGVRTDQFESCPGLLGMEIWNAGCQLELGRGDATLQWDEALERGTLLYGIAADDSHHPGFDSAFAWTWVRAAGHTRQAVLDALRAGRFYSSTGPEIQALEMGPRTVTVRCSPAASVTLFAGRRRGARVNAGRLGYPNNGRVVERAGDGSITAVELRKPRGSSPYGRIEVADPAGRRAWTNPLWL